MPAKRAYGMDQDFYPWSPIVTRPILRWSENAVIVNLEHWYWEVPAGTPVAVSPIGGHGARQDVLIEEGRRRGAEFVAYGLSRRRIIHIGSEMNRKLALHHLGCLQRGRRGRHGGRRRSSRQVGLLAPG